jgi:hypothetical protein
MSKMKVRLLAMAFGFFLVTGTAYAGPVPGGLDSDGDTVENAFDNCVNASNAPQTDTDHNGCGNTCTQDITCDVNGDTSVLVGDFNTLRMNFGNTVPAGTQGDCSPVDGSVLVTDFNRLRMNFGNTTGPSGITTAQCDPSSCRCTPQ